MVGVLWWRAVVRVCCMVIKNGIEYDVSMEDRNAEYLDVCLI